MSDASRLFDERDREMIRATVEAASARGRGKMERGVPGGAHRWERSVGLHSRTAHLSREPPWSAARALDRAVIDITHLKETETALRESELRLRFALDAAAWAPSKPTSPATKRALTSRRLCCSGCPEDTRNVSAEELRKRIPLEDLQASDAKQARMTEHREAYHHEFRLGMPDGSERWLSAYADVRADRIFGVNFDVTQRKLAEAALQDE